MLCLSQVLDDRDLTVYPYAGAVERFAPEWIFKLFVYYHISCRTYQAAN